MEYALFLGLNKIKIGIYPNFEEAEAAINGKGVWNICTIQTINGKFKVLSRVTIVVK